MPCLRKPRGPCAMQGQTGLFTKASAIPAGSVLLCSELGCCRIVGRNGICAMFGMVAESVPSTRSGCWIVEMLPVSRSRVSRTAAANFPRGYRELSRFSARRKGRVWDLPAVPYACGERHPLPSCRHTIQAQKGSDPAPIRKRCRSGHDNKAASAKWSEENRLQTSFDCPNSSI
jgi:hypothetical protein